MSYISFLMDAQGEVFDVRAADSAVDDRAVTENSTKH